MKLSLNIDSKLMADAKKITGIQEESILIEKALHLLISVESQKDLIALKGRIKNANNVYK
jgi:hypothetical protein